jgi:hypothetical protein
MNNHSELLSLAGEIRQLSVSMDSARETLKSEVVSFLTEVTAELRSLNKTMSEIERGHRPSWMGGGEYYQNVPGPLVIPEVK